MGNAHATLQVFGLGNLGTAAEGLGNEQRDLSGTPMLSYIRKYKWISLHAGSFHRGFELIIVPLQVCLKESWRPLRSLHLGIKSTHGRVSQAQTESPTPISLQISARLSWKPGRIAAPMRPSSQSMTSSSSTGRSRQTRTADASPKKAFPGTSAPSSRSR